MAEKSKIAWTDSTFNPWIGCTRVGPGCDHCYAEAQDSRKRWGGTTHWGPGVPRHRTSESYWKQPLAWDKKAAASGKVHRVFCASLADVFDNEVPDEWRADLWRLIRATQNLSWLLVTKRIGNAAKMWPGGDYPNVRLIITVVNQEEADRDIPKLLALPCKNGISYEPALGPVDFHLDKGWCRHCKVMTSGAIDGHCMDPLRPCFEAEALMQDLIGWIIIGGESAQGGAQARPFDLAWARSTIAQCKAAGVPVFCKQVGSNPVWGDESSSLGRALREGGYTLKDRAGADPSEWPEDLRIQQFPT